MKQIIQDLRRGNTILEEVPAPMVRNGCLLIKPNMEHIETWPNIYQNNKTYLPIDWDGDNVVDVLNTVANHTSNYKDIVEQGREEYRQALIKWMIKF